MPQWDKLRWKKEHCIPGGIHLKPRKNEDGSTSIHTSHPLSFHRYNDKNPDHIDPIGLHDLDWSKEAAQHPGGQMAHAHDGTVDHIVVHPVARGDAISLHASWYDKDGNEVRKDGLIQF